MRQKVKAYRSWNSLWTSLFQQYDHSYLQIWGGRKWLFCWNRHGCTRTHWWVIHNTRKTEIKMNRQWHLLESNYGICTCVHHETKEHFKIRIWVYAACKSPAHRTSANLISTSGQDHSKSKPNKNMRLGSCKTLIRIAPKSFGTMLFFSTHLLQTVLCQLTRASTIKTGVMGSVAVINSREGNEVTVDSQFSKRKLAFITHLILWSKQVSCARLSTGDMTTSFAETIILMWWRERNSKNKKRREGGRRKHINQEGHWNSPCCIMWWSSRGNANYKWGHPVICRWLVWCGFFSTLWCFLAPNFCGMTAITLTGSALLLCPISFTIKLSEKHEPIINYWRGKIGQAHAAILLYRGSWHKSLIPSV